MRFLWEFHIILLCFVFEVFYFLFFFFRFQCSESIPSACMEVIRFRKRGHGRGWKWTALSVGGGGSGDVRSWLAVADVQRRGKLTGKGNGISNGVWNNTAGDVFALDIMYHSRWAFVSVGSILWRNRWLIKIIEAKWPVGSRLYRFYIPNLFYYWKYFNVLSVSVSLGFVLFFFLYKALQNTMN